MASKDQRYRDAADGVMRYARAVVDGEVVSGEFIRRVCRSHIRDRLRVRKADSPYTFDSLAAGRVLCFIEDICVVPGADADDDEVVPIRLMPWQVFLVGNIFGWKSKETGYRRFRSSYCQVAKSAGKSGLVSAIALYCLTSDRERNPQCFVAAHDFRQAGIVFQNIVRTVKHHKGFGGRVKVRGGDIDNREIVLLSSKGDPIGQMSRLSGGPEGRGKGGFTPSLAVFDEVAEWRDAVTLDNIRRGTGKDRKQPLNLFITNAGSGIDSVAYPLYEKAKEVAFGRDPDPTMFPMVFELDEGDDPFADDAEEKVWPKTNPSLDRGLPTIEYLRHEVANAKSMPSIRNLARRFHFNEWVEASEDYFIDIEEVDSVFVDRIDDEHLKGLPLVIGIDLSNHLDLSAAVMLWRKGDRFYARSHFWMPADGLIDRSHKERLPFDAWERAGFITATPGAVIDYRYVARYLIDAKDRWGTSLRGVASDKYNDRYFRKDADAEGLRYHDADKDGIRVRPNGSISFWKHPQGTYQGSVKIKTGHRVSESGLTHALWAPGSIKLLETAILTRNMVIEDNPVLRLCFLSVKVSTDKMGNKTLSKGSKGRAHIDGVVALMNAIGLLDATPATPPRQKRRLVANISI